MFSAEKWLYHDFKYIYNYAARQTRTDDPLVNSQLSFGAQYHAANLLYHAELEPAQYYSKSKDKINLWALLHTFFFRVYV